MSPPQRFHIQVGLWAPPHPGQPDPTPIPGTENTAYVYRPDGTHVGDLHLATLHTLHKRYNEAARTHPQLHTKYMITDGFPEAVARLLLRYKPARQRTGPEKAHGKPSVSSRGEATLTSALRQALADTFAAPFTDRLSSPLNAHDMAHVYFTRFPEDELFGANCNAYASTFTGLSLAHPEPAPETVRHATTWARMCADHDTQCHATIIPVPWDPKAPYMRLLEPHRLTLIARIPPTHPCGHSAQGNGTLAAWEDNKSDPYRRGIALLASTNEAGWNWLRATGMASLRAAIYQHGEGATYPTPALTATNTIAPPPHTLGPPQLQARHESPPHHTW